MAVIEPPEAFPVVEPLRSRNAPPPIFAPPWSLLCLRAYLIKRAGYLCQLIDTRLFNHFEQELVKALEQMPNLRVAVVNTSSLSLGQAMATMETIKRRFPAIKTVMCGPHPSQFPGLVQHLPWLDYALCGDPEPILRNLLARLDGKAKTQDIPGCIMADQPVVEPFWKMEPDNLFLFHEEGIDWRAYPVGPVRQAIMRLTRGSAGNIAAGLADEDFYQPLRTCPHEQAANILCEFRRLDITEVRIADPPGFWSHWEIEAWCETLLSKDNYQSWSIKLLPVPLTESTIGLLQAAHCKHVVFVCPSTDLDVLAKLGCVLPLRKFRATLDQLTAADISFHLHFWMGGLETNTQKRWDIIRILHDLKYPPFTLEPHPSNQPLEVDREKSYDPAHIEAWIAWAKGPGEKKTRPKAPWTGNVPVADFVAAMNLVGLTVQRSPLRWLRHTLRSIYPNHRPEAADQRSSYLFGTLQTPQVVKKTSEASYSDPTLLSGAAHTTKQTDSINSKQEKTSGVAAHPRGIRGWLLFFCILYTIIFPIWFSRMAWFMWKQGLHGWFMDGSIKHIAIVEGAWIGLVTLIGIAVGWTVWRGNPWGKQIAMSYLLFRGIGFIGCHFLLRFLFYDIASEQTVATMNAAWLGQLIREGLLVVLWWMYFRRSKRVKNTYGNALNL